MLIFAAKSPSAYTATTSSKNKNFTWTAVVQVNLLDFCSKIRVMNTNPNNATGANDSRSAAPATALHQNDGVNHPQNRQTSNLKSPKNQTPTPQKQPPRSPRSIKLRKTLSNFLNPKKRNSLFFTIGWASRSFRSPIFGFRFGHPLPPQATNVA